MGDDNKAKSTIELQWSRTTSWYFVWDHQSITNVALQKRLDVRVVVVIVVHDDGACAVPLLSPFRGIHTWGFISFEQFDMLVANQKGAVKPLEPIITVSAFKRSFLQLLLNIQFEIFKRYDPRWSRSSTVAAVRTDYIVTRIRLDFSIWAIPCDVVTWLLNHTLNFRCKQSLEMRPWFVWKNLGYEQSVGFDTS